METAIFPVKLARQDQEVEKDLIQPEMKGNLMEGLQLRIELAS